MAIAIKMAISREVEVEVDVAEDISALTWRK